VFAAEAASETPTPPQEPEPKGRLWLFIISAYSKHFNINRMIPYATDEQDALARGATWIETKKCESYTEITITQYSGGFTIGSVRTLPGYVDADGSPPL
jgi:hypothetical protein